MAAIIKLNKEELGKLLIPAKIHKIELKKELSQLFEKLYYDNINYITITNLFFLSIIISFVIYIIVYPTIQSMEFFAQYIQASFFAKAGIIFATYFIINFIVYNSVMLAYLLYHEGKFKKHEDEIEKDMPEFIDNLVSNLKGGISLEKALLKSVRPEQTALLKEVTLINEKILMGKNVRDALHEFRKRLSSAVINRTVFLIEEGIKGGGNLAAPLERISQNLKRITSLEEEIKGNASGFAIIIKGITLFVAPLLFALALTLLTFIGQLFSLLAESNSDLGFAVELDPKFSVYLKFFSYAMIIMITFFSSLITSQLKNEKAYTAVKYLPMFIIIALVLFWFFLGLLLSFFSGIIQ